jgi:hypothetical protein
MDLKAFLEQTGNEKEQREWENPHIAGLVD